MKTTITGQFDGKPFNLTIESPLDGKESAVFVADFYNELMVQVPSLLANAEKHMPIIANAMRKLNNVFEVIAKTLQ
jgi:hypothetical protein